MAPEKLRAFEASIADMFNRGKIRYPVHLSDGSEDAMIAAFEDVLENDWVCCGWRSHYQCLLKGVPPDELTAAILAGNSIALCFPEYRIVSSAIVGGILPIAVGIAMGIKRAGAAESVHCWLGDMTSWGGMFHECRTYAANHGLPIRWIVEDNGISVCTPTTDVWGHPGPGEIIHYKYASKYPHAGSGRRIQF